MQKIEIEIQMKTPLFFELDIPMLAFAKSAATLLADLAAVVTSSYKLISLQNHCVLLKQPSKPKTSTWAR